MKLRERRELERKFEDTFKNRPADFFDIGGRFEMLGNHTDHNRGLCLVSACDLLMKAAARKREDDVISVFSEGYGLCSFSAKSIRIGKKEKPGFPRLVKGLSRLFLAEGHRLIGLELYVSSDLMPGSGVSSSAAFEMLLLHIYNVYFNDGKIRKLPLCLLASLAEKKYLNKSSGLLDQIAVSYGGVNYIDFKDPKRPVVRKLAFPFKDMSFVLVDAGGTHAGLSHLYDEIPYHMKEVAHLFHKSCLRDVDEKLFHLRTDDRKKDKIDKTYLKVDYVPLKRARHFFAENNRVRDSLKALKDKDSGAFLTLINDSQSSSENNLLNTQIESDYAGSPQEAVDYLYANMEKGAVKINGGGFAGTVIAFVPKDELDHFLKIATVRFGKERVKPVKIRPAGVRRLQI